MKLIMDLLISLHQRCAVAEAASHHGQLSPGEKWRVLRQADLVREVIPKEVVAYYEQLRITEDDLRDYPELLAMAVLVSTYRSLSPAKRKKLLNHFRTAPTTSTPVRLNGLGFAIKMRKQTPAALQATLSVPH
jgi:hypothetical protein